jgi:hypothetical protein
VGFIVSIVLFMIGRMIVLWYFKIDRAIELLESIDHSLKQLPAVRSAQYDVNPRRVA